MSQSMLKVTTLALLYCRIEFDSARLVRLSQCLGQLQPLRLAAAQRWGRMPQCQVAEPDLHHHGQRGSDDALVVEQPASMLGAYGEDIILLPFVQHQGYLHRFLSFRPESSIYS